MESLLMVLVAGISFVLSFYLVEIPIYGLVVSFCKLSPLYRGIRFNLIFRSSTSRVKGGWAFNLETGCLFSEIINGKFENARSKVLPA